MLLKVGLKILLGLLVCHGVWADTLKLNPNHPDQYTVVKGDTLWDISGKFLQHPWQWPQLWESNPQIKDPHWIYPGNTLYFGYQDGQPRLSLQPFGQEQKLQPQVRVSEIEEPIKMIPTDLVRPFLSSPKVVTEQELKQAPYVLALAGEHLLAGAGDQIYVRGLPENPPEHFTVYRQGSPFVSPLDHSVLGFEAQYVANASLTVAGDPATLVINKSAGQIREGDRLMVTEDESLSLNFFPRPPEQPITGSILRVLGGVSQIGQFDVVVIDKGTADGVEVGHTLNVLQKGKLIVDRYASTSDQAVKLPDRRAGVIMVFRPFERVSYALVMQAAGPIHTLDIVQTP